MNAGGDAVEGGGVREYAGGDQIASPCAAVSKLRLFDLTARRSPSPSPMTFRRRRGDHVAEAENVTRSFVNRLLRLTLLSPDIVEAILDGRQPKGMQLEELSRAMPSEWKEQLNQLIIASGA